MNCQLAFTQASFLGHFPTCYTVSTERISGTKIDKSGVERKSKNLANANKASLHFLEQIQYLGLFCHYLSSGESFVLCERFTNSFGICRAFARIGDKIIRIE